MAIEVDDKTFLVLGTGAMACLFAARLSAAGANGVMLGPWNEGWQALRESGVRLVSPDGSEKAFPIRLINRAQESSGVRFALVLVKSWQTSRAAQQPVDCLAEEGLG